MHIASSAGAGTSAALAGRDGRTQADAGRGRGAAHSWKCAGRGREGQGAAGAQRQRHHSVLHRGGAECADFTPCCARTPARTRWGKQEASQKQFGLRCTFFFPKAHLQGFVIPGDEESRNRMQWAAPQRMARGAMGARGLGTALVLLHVTLVSRSAAQDGPSRYASHRCALIGCAVSAAHFPGIPTPGFPTDGLLYVSRCVQHSFVSPTMPVKRPMNLKKPITRSIGACALVAASACSAIACFVRCHRARRGGF